MERGMKKFLSILAVLITAAVLVVAGACASESEREDVPQTNMCVQEQAVGGEPSETVGNTKSELKNDADSLIGADGIAAGEVGERASGCPRLKVNPGDRDVLACDISGGGSDFQPGEKLSYRGASVCQKNYVAGDYGSYVVHALNLNCVSRQ